MAIEVFRIKKEEISGVNNPLLHLEVEVDVNDYEVEAFTDERKLQPILQKYPASNFFVCDIELSQKDKKVKVYLKYEDKKVLIIKVNNTKAKRVKNKIISKLKKPFLSVLVVFVTLGKGIKFLWKEYHFLVPFSMWKKYLKDFKTRISFKDLNLYFNPFNTLEYNKWLKKNEVIEEYIEPKYKPLISILIPVYNIGREYLSDCIDSIINQSYSNFEVCLVDDCSTNPETKDTLEEYSKKDKRIKVKYRKENGHISKATNDALKMAKGEFVALMDNDDMIPCNALYEMVKVLNKNKEIDMIYTDEDKINLDGKRCDPNFKSDFAPDSLLTSNYICHFTLLRKSIMDEIGGERVGFEGAQDYDLFLRFTEKTTRDKIYHIPKILYHWRMVEGSTSMVIDNKGYALERGRKAVEEALERRNIKGTVKIAEGCPYYYIEYDVSSNPMVSIIIPTKDLAKITEKCIKSIYEKATYKNYEIIVVNNRSEKKETFDMFEKYKKAHKNFKVLDADMEFNYSAINNLAVKNCKGEYLLLLNNDTEVITPNFIELMLGYAMQKHVGAVGAQLVYPDNTVQHGGVIVGLGGVAGHAFVDYPKGSIVWGGRLTVPYNYGAVTAACLMVEKKKYNEVKGLDENLKVAFNDIDFNLKLQTKGYYNVLVPMAQLYHYESKSRGMDNTTEKYKRFVSEVNLMSEKWGKRLENDPFYNPNYSLRKSYYLDKNK